MLYQFNLICSSFLNQQRNRLLFITITAILYSLTLPYFGFSLYTWLALVPVLLIIKSAPSFQRAIIEALVFFLIYNLISFSWLWGIHPLDWQGLNNQQSLIISGLACLTPAIFHSLVLLPFIISCRLFYRYRADSRSHELKVLDISLLTFIWVAIEHKLLFNLGADLGVFSVPVNLLVYSNYQNTTLIQICKIIGAIGLEYIIVFTNLSIANLFNIQSNTNYQATASTLNIKQPFCGLQKAQTEVNLFIGILSGLILIFAYGCWELNKPSKKHIHKNFAIVQADSSAAATRSQSYNSQTLINLELTLTNKITEPVDLLLWTEGSVPELDKVSLENNQFISMLNIHKAFAFGTYTQDKDDIYNSIEFLEFNQSTLNKQIYNKNLLVPFGEYTPWYQYLPEPIKQLAGSTVGDGFSANNEIGKTISLRGFTLGPNICFELLFPHLVRSSVINGAEVLLNLNDLSWFKNWLEGDIIKKQFLAIAVFRAVENNRDLILAGNSGYSGLITAKGQIQQLSKANTISVLNGSFTLHHKKSIYTVYGW